MQVLVKRVGKNLKDPKEPEPMAPLYPILQGGIEEEFLFPPPYQPLEPPQAPAIPPPRADASEGGPTQNTCHRWAMSPVRLVDSTVALPLRVADLPDKERNQPHQYWPFSTSNLYNWRSQNAEFSHNPRDLTNLLETVLFLISPPETTANSRFSSPWKRERKYRTKPVKGSLGQMESPLII